MFKSNDMIWVVTSFVEQGGGVTGHCLNRRGLFKQDHEAAMKFWSQVLDASK